MSWHSPWPTNARDRATQSVRPVGLQGGRTWSSNIQALKSGARCAVGQRLRPAGSISSNCRCKFRKFRCAGETRGKMPALADAKANWRDEPVDIGVDGEMAGRVAAQGRLGPQDRPFSRVRFCDPLAFAASAAEELLKTFNHVARAVMDLRLPQRSWRCRHRHPCLSQQHPPPPRLHHSGAPACRHAVTRSWRSQRRYGPD